MPWGRSFDESVEMFALARGDLAARILGCGDGPASFNVELTRRGGRVVSLDPLYVCSADAIRERIGEVTPAVLEQLRQNLDAFIWRRFESVDALAAASVREVAYEFQRGGHQMLVVARTPSGS